MRWRWKRFGDAVRGIAAALRSETHLVAQVVVAMVVLLAGIFTGLSTAEWMMVTACIALVLSLELANTAIEKLCDVVHPDYHPLIGQVKDIAAGAVLVAAIASAIIGCLIFAPHLWRWLAT